MLNKDAYFRPDVITVITNDERLIEEVNKFGKKLELDSIEHKKNNPHLYEAGFLSDSYPIISANNDKNADLVIVASDIDNYKPDKNKYNIELHNGNRIDGFDSYIYTDNYNDAIMDLMKMAYESGLVSIDFDDIVKFLYNRSFNYCKYTLESPVSTDKVKELINDKKDKNCIGILYGSKNMCLTEVDNLMSAFKNYNSNLFCAQLDESVAIDKRVVSIYVEEE